MTGKRKVYILLCLLGGLVLAGCTLTGSFKYSGTSSSTEVMPLEQLQQALGPDVALVVYYMMPDELAIWVLRGGRLVTHL